MGSSIFDTWMNDWVQRNPPADTIEACTDVVSTAEIKHQLYLETQHVCHENEIHDYLGHKEYTYQNGGWLVL